MVRDTKDRYGRLIWASGLLKKPQSEKWGCADAVAMHSVRDRDCNNAGNN